MSQRRALRIRQNSNSPVGFIEEDPTGMWIGMPCKWQVNLTVEPLIDSGFTPAFNQNANTISVGDWIATSSRGVAVRVIEVVSVNSDTDVDLIVEDVNNYNIYTDPAFLGVGIGPDGDGYLFPVDESGFPILGPIDAYTVDLTFQSDLLARFLSEDLITVTTLEVPTDGTYSDGAIRNWKPSITTYTDALDDLNEALLALAPELPTPLSEASINLDSLNQPNGGRRFRLATQNDLTNNTTLPTVASATQVFRVESGSAVSLVTGAFGPTNYGTLAYQINTNPTVSNTLSKTGNAGFGELAFVGEQPSPLASNGFWKAASIELSFEPLDGINQIQLSHDFSASTTQSFVVTDYDLTASISVDYVNAETDINFPLIYSSGVPHFSNFTLSSAGIATGLVTNTYVENPIRFKVKDIETSTFFIGWGSNSLVSVPSKDSNTIFSIEHQVAGNESFSGKASVEVVGPSDSAIYDSSVLLNYMNPNPLSPSTFMAMTEGEFRALGIPYKRMLMADGATPIVPSNLLYDTDFNSGGPGSTGDLLLHDAVIVGGALRHSVVDYSTALPAGPDYSNKPTTQYATFKTKTVTNRIRITIDGTFSGLYVCMPGVNYDMPEAVNGWWNALEPANFPAGYWPGCDTASDGCLAVKIGNQYELTFGSISSAKSSDNLILFRFVMEEGDVINRVAIS